LNLLMRIYVFTQIFLYYIFTSILMFILGLLTIRNIQYKSIRARCLRISMRGPWTEGQLT
ncbi:unnamed protein product, partial [Rotaria sp. Silwood2]